MENITSDIIEFLRSNGIDHITFGLSNKMIQQFKINDDVNFSDDQIIFRFSVLLAMLNIKLHAVLDKIYNKKNPEKMVYFRAHAIYLYVVISKIFEKVPRARIRNRKFVLNLECSYDEYLPSFSEKMNGIFHEITNKNEYDKYINMSNDIKHESEHSCNFIMVLLHMSEIYDVPFVLYKLDSSVAVLKKFKKLI